ncbi:MAG: ABC transporter ATP-binding protein [Leptospiraceae bacterium]|nr:ABC transporter ATP-binding protein [Leptospiraceae bacterium]
MSDSKVKKESAWPILRRLFRYVLRYRYRMLIGLCLAFLVSISNLLSLSTFVPIFNTIGQDGPPHIFVVSYQEHLLSGCRLEKRGQPLESSLKNYLEKLDTKALQEDLDFNPGNGQTWRDFCGAFPDSLMNRFRYKLAQFKLNINRYMANKSSGEAVLLICTALLPVYLIKIFSLIGTVYFIGTAGLLAVRDLRMELYRHMNELDLQYFGKERTGIIMSRISNDAEIVGKSMSMELTDALVNILYILTHLPALIYINWQLLLITLIVGPVLVSPVSNFAVKIRRAFTNQQERLADLGGHIQEVISGIRVIRAFGMENYEHNRFAKINLQLFKNTFKGHYYHQVGPALTDLVAGVVVIGFLAYGAWAISAGNLDRGSFMAFFFVLLFVMRPIKQISVMANLMSAAVAAADRIFGMLAVPVTIKEPLQPVSNPDFKKKIEYRNVSFRYDGTSQDALSEINIHIEYGKSYALVGSSGAGKTTLLDLLPRFYDVSEGCICIDGVDIRSMRILDLREMISLVGQDVFLFHSSIRDNIAYGRSDISLASIMEAAKIANAHEFITALPKGYDTEIGERGVMLSGGQRQRLALARAVLLDPPILILDEATSNLDNESELLVQNALEELMQKRTVLVIAHRLSTIYNCDQILVLEQGRIAEQGTHKELLEANGAYKRLFDLQFNASAG